MTHSDFSCPLKYPTILNSTAVTIVSGANPLRYSKPLWITDASVVKIDVSLSPKNHTPMNTTTPTDSPMPIPVSIAFLALSSFPAPTFCDTNEAIDCISELGTSMAKLTILQATPYPDDASKPSLLINAHSARNDICVRNSCIASGSPTESNLLHCLFNLKSFLDILNGSSLFFSSTSARTTLTAWATTVAMAAPAASR